MDTHTWMDLLDTRTIAVLLLAVWAIAAILWLRLTLYPHMDVDEWPLDTVSSSDIMLYDAPQGVEDEQGEVQPAHRWGPTLSAAHGWVVRFTAVGPIYLSANRHWTTELEHAYKFEFKTGAAIWTEFKENLGPSDFDIIEVTKVDGVWRLHND